jgi:serine O-acetyltransferase
MFDNIRADYRSHGRRLSRQGFWVLVVYRFGRWRFGIKPRLLRMPFSWTYHFLFKLSQILTGVELPCETVIGKNFIIDHFGGIIISGYARFGDNCRVRNGVVVGLRNVEEPIAPVFGNDVDIGTGAKILGPIRIGDRVAIGANAVVLRDIPDDHIAVGVPAVAKPRRKDAGVP